MQSVRAFGSSIVRERGTLHRLLGVLLTVALISVGCAGNANADGPCIDDDEHTVARHWNEQLLDAIRRDTPAPTVHSRNLYHVSAAMWDAWAAFNDEATAVYVDAAQSIGELTVADRDIVISYAAYTMLTERYRNAVGFEESLASFDAELQRQCLALPSESRNLGDAADLGVDIAEQILDATIDDGALELDGYIDLSYVSVNEPLQVAEVGVGELADIDRWQPLELDVALTQNQLEAGSLQTFIGPQWGWVEPFAIDAAGDDGVPIDPGTPPLFAESSDGLRAAAMEVIRYQAALDVIDSPVVDRGPASIGNNPLGTNDGAGYGLNPVTGEPYEPNPLADTDFGRVVAEFWADGPDSETPPGHWNTVANFVSDHPDQDFRFRGEGEPLDRLEWDVKMYITLNGAVHDAAIAAWGAKRYFDSSRPITIVRYLAELGQSSDPNAASYHPDGLELVDGLVELVTDESSEDRHIGLEPGTIAIRGWAGHGSLHFDLDEIDWIDGRTWVPYQLDTFVTPSFPGYISGHSTFSRAAAEVLTAFTGTPYFPGGLGEWEIPAFWLRFDFGPTEPLTLQWATYYDAADQAGESRLYGGIHISADDVDGRRVGAEVGQTAVDRAFALFG